MKKLTLIVTWAACAAGIIGAGAMEVYHAAHPLAESHDPWSTWLVLWCPPYVLLVLAGLLSVPRKGSHPWLAVLSVLIVVLLSWLCYDLMAFSIARLEARAAGRMMMRCDFGMSLFMVLFANGISFVALVWSILFFPLNTLRSEPSIPQMDVPR